MNAQPSRAQQQASADWWPTQLDLWLRKCIDQPDAHSSKALAHLLAQYMDLEGWPGGAAESADLDARRMNHAGDGVPNVEQPWVDYEECYSYFFIPTS